MVGSLIGGMIGRGVGRGVGRGAGGGAPPPPPLSRANSSATIQTPLYGPPLVAWSLQLSPISDPMPIWV
jgi:hypothetical protein